MILKNLTLCDFGLFQGRHYFDLAPRIKYGHKCPIILFGGLNGSGKTTLLTAIRLAFYGKQSLGPTVSKKIYQQFLLEAIHNSRNDLIQPNSAAIEVTFIYARQGEYNEYQIRRAWTHQTGEVNETLTIAQDGELLKEFSLDLCQAFLNELIPIGVSDLFFFDGEKIAELAEDDTGEILQQAVRKLLGLDIIERLRNDLAIYLKQRQKETVLPADMNKEIHSLEISFQETLANKTKEIAATTDMRKQMKKLEQEIQQLENAISDGGGAYAKTGELEHTNQARLTTEQEELKHQIRDVLGGAFPLSLVQNQLVQLFKQLEKEVTIKKQQGLTEILKERLQQLNTNLVTVIPPKYLTPVVTTIEHTFADLLAINNDNSLIIHDLSETTLAKMQYWIQQVIPHSVETLQTLKQRLTAVEEELEQVSLRLERAPDSSTIKANLYVLNNKNQQLGELQAKSEQHLEQARALHRAAMELNRQMQKLHTQKRDSWLDNKAIFYARNARNLLEEFSLRTTQRRIVELEEEFIKAFQRLSRKDDVRIRAKIDPETFDVTLLDDQGKQLTKNKLSAGEKQIYAIAILEALARTSGRKLPIIIDTPLGRLDSKHRAKLVKHYFPYASHQVIILSTDTEVDRDFYQSLTPEISHAFHLQYDPVKGCSFAQMGYFWRNE